MKPRDLTRKNWDVNVAVFERPELGLDARVTADGTRMWFRLSIGQAFSDILIPIKEFKRAVDFVDAFDTTKLTAKNPDAGLVVGRYGVRIFSMIGRFRNKKWVMKTMPIQVVLSPVVRRHTSSLLCIRLSLFKKMIRWYNSDI